MTNNLSIISDKLVTSGKWAFLARFSQILGGSLVFLLLPFWISPNDFGLITVISSILALLLIFQQPGIMESIIQNEFEPEKLRDTALIMNLCISLILYIVIFFSAPYIETFFNQGKIAFPLRIISLQIIFMGLSNIPLAWMQRNFQYKKYALIQLVSSISLIGITIILAISGIGIWSYILGIVGSSAVRVLLIIVFIDWKPIIAINQDYLKRVFRFGIYVLFEMILGWFLIWFDNIAVAKNLGSEAAGIYSLAFSIATTCISLPLSTITGITLPTFSRLQNEGTVLQSAYLKGTKLIASFSIPACIGLSILGPSIINTIYPGRWANLGEIFSILILYAGFGNLWILNTDFFKAIGKPQTMLKIYIPSVIIMAPLFWLGSKYGLTQFSYIRTIVILVGAPLHSFYAIKYAHLSWDYLLRIIKNPLIASFIMALTIGLFSGLISYAQFSSSLLKLISLLIILLTGFGVYLLSISKLDLELYEELKNIVFVSLKKVKYD